MPPNRRRFLGSIGGALVLAGCVGDDADEADDAGAVTDDADDGDGSGAGDETTETLGVYDHETHGEILVDGDGLALYLFDEDEQGTDVSACHDDCAASWPPLTVESEPEAEIDAEVTTFERDDGEVQVAVDGWPLYYYAGDDEAGDGEGQGVNDVWWLLDGNGTPIREDGYDDDGYDDGDDGYGTGPGY